LPSILASPDRADIKITGIACVVGLPRSAFSNSKPSMLGIITSIEQRKAFKKRPAIAFSYLLEVNLTAKD